MLNNQSMKLITDNVCENCGVGPLKAFEIPNQTRLWECTACGLYQKGAPPRELAYEETYHSNYESAIHRKIRTAHVRLCRLESYLEAESPTLLDVGCSVGATVTAAERRGWTAHGVDVSRTAVDACRRRRLQCKVYDGSSLPYADSSFDVVTSWHVIEHVQDVRATLEEWYRVLRPGGLIMLETPHARCWKAWLMKERYAKFWPPEHIYTFTPETLSPFVERIGFEIMPTPLVVIPKKVGMTTSIFALAHQSYLAATRLTGFCKAFQLIARKPRNLSASTRAA